MEGYITIEWYQHNWHALIHFHLSIGEIKLCCNELRHATRHDMTEDHELTRVQITWTYGIDMDIF
jgi:hypothetical protein